MHPVLESVLSQVHAVIVGQDRVLRSVLAGLMASGHVLLEGPPGLAKTLMLKTLTQVMGGSFKRIQFTPDLLPADILGTKIYDTPNSRFETVRGPIFANLVLADEINRAPAKVQSALLEAMQEQQVTIGGETFPLPDPFFVMATQNPIETEGTYPLPEAQVDRFMLKIPIHYPARDEEIEILDRMAREEIPRGNQVASPDEIRQLQLEVRRVYLDPKLKGYVVDLIQATRAPLRFGLDFKNWIQYGASPRAALFLALASKAVAYLEGRAYVLPEDVKAIASEVICHRILLSYEAMAEEIKPEWLLEKILASVPVP